MTDTAEQVKVGTVYVIQTNMQHEYWPAEAFGTLRHCLPSRADMEMRKMVPRLREALIGFDAKTDYVLLSGAPIACAVAFAILHEKLDRFNVLRWSVPAQDYLVAVVDLMATNGNDHEEIEP